MVGEISDFRLMIMVKICQWAVVVKKVTIKVSKCQAIRLYVLLFSHSRRIAKRR